MLERSLRLLFEEWGVQRVSLVRVVTFSKFRFVSKIPLKGPKKKQWVLSYRKKRKAFLPRSSSAEKISRRGGERYPTTKVHANADETLSARIRAQQRSNRTRLDIFIVFPPFLRLHTRLRATHFISPIPRHGTKKETKGESNPIRERAQKK